jgi:hypothetical protein
MSSVNSKKRISVHKESSYRDRGQQLTRANLGASVRAALRANSMLSNFDMQSESESNGMDLVLFHEDVVSALRKLRVHFRPHGITISDAQFEWLLAGASKLFRLRTKLIAEYSSRQHSNADENVNSNSNAQQPAAKSINQMSFPAHDTVTFVAFSGWFCTACDILVNSSSRGEEVPSEAAWTAAGAGAWVSDVDHLLFHGTNLQENTFQRVIIYGEGEVYAAGSSRSDLSLPDEGDYKDHEETEHFRL